MKKYVLNVYKKLFKILLHNTDIATFALGYFIFTHPVELPVYNDFDTPSTKTIAIDGDFSFVPNYLMRLFYLLKLTRTKQNHENVTEKCDSD